MHRAHGHVRRGAFDYLCPGIQINAQVAGSLIGIGGSIHAPEGGLDAHISILIVNAAALGDAVPDEGDRTYRQNAENYNHGDDDQNDLEGAAAILLGNGSDSGRGKTEAAAAPGWVVPHLLQNFAPLSRVAPQELQNAIASPRVSNSSQMAEYIANHSSRVV